jgi:hypothetical protein
MTWLRPRADVRSRFIQKAHITDKEKKTKLPMAAVRASGGGGPVMFWYHSAVSTAMPTQNAKDPRTCFWPRRAKVENHRRQPETSFNDERGRDGRPQPKSECLADARRERHLPVGDDVEHPVADDNREEYPRGARVAPARYVDRC